MSKTVGATLCHPVPQMLHMKVQDFMIFCLLGFGLDLIQSFPCKLSVPLLWNKNVYMQSYIESMNPSL